MSTQTKPYRYQLPKKAIKADCPQCGPRHRKTLSRYVDSRTGEALPELYGRCDRESNCGYQLSPYQKTASGMSYADEVNQYSQMPPIPKLWFRIAGKWKRNGCAREGVVSGFQDALIGATPEQAEKVAKFIFDKATRSTQPTLTTPIYCIPDEVFSPTLGHYQHNQFARLLSRQFGNSEALTLLQRFQIGTSARWPGACVFWLKDEQHRVRAGQVVLFANDWHKANYADQEGNQKVCISSVSHGLLRRYRQQEQPAPDWLTDYHKNAPRWPILFGLHQIATAPVDQPVAIVEAPKTAVVCSALIPDFVWLAVGALSYLNAERLAPLRGRAVKLFPDLSKDGKAFARWSKVADDLNTKCYQISVSDLLEQGATNQQKEQGLDLADFLLNTPVVVHTLAEWATNPGSICRPYESQLERLIVEPCDTYPAEWDN
ncbi:DUF6371 domain-containing protein [Spirosoma arcticum]